jgi:aryl-alcohol dehydrogenase-like predicted oxidoreductase
MPYYTHQRSVDGIDEYAVIAKELGISMTQLSLAWINQRRFVTSNIIGTTDVEQMRECLNSIDITLSAEVFEKIDDIFRQNPNPSCW